MCRSIIKAPNNFEIINGKIRATSYNVYASNSRTAANKRLIIVKTNFS